MWAFRKKSKYCLKFSKIISVNGYFPFSTQIHFNKYNNTLILGKIALAKFFFFHYVQEI